MARFKNGTLVRQNVSSMVLENRPRGRKSPNFIYGTIMHGKFVADDIIPAEKICEEGCEIKPEPKDDGGSIVSSVRTQCSADVIMNAIREFQKSVHANVVKEVVEKFREQTKDVLSDKLVDSIVDNIVKSITK